MQDEKQLKGNERWLVVKSDNMTSNALAHLTNYCNSYMTFNTKDVEPEGTYVEVDRQLKKDLRFFVKVVHAFSKLFDIECEIVNTQICKGVVYAFSKPFDVKCEIAILKFAWLNLLYLKLIRSSLVG